MATPVNPQAASPLDHAVLSGRPPLAPSPVSRDPHAQNATRAPTSAPPADSYPKPLPTVAMDYGAYAPPPIARPGPYGSSAASTPTSVQAPAQMASQMAAPAANSAPGSLSALSSGGSVPGAPGYGYSAHPSHAVPLVHPHGPAYPAENPYAVPYSLPYRAPAAHQMSHPPANAPMLQQQSSLYYVPSGPHFHPSIEEHMYGYGRAYHESSSPMHHRYSPYTNGPVAYSHAQEQPAGVRPQVLPLKSLMASRSGSSSSNPSSNSIKVKAEPQDALGSGTKKYYKPTHTKKNSRPKINKIASDPDPDRAPYAKPSRADIEEESLSAVYDEFSRRLGISHPRANLAKTHKYVLADKLEAMLFDLFVNRIALFIDTSLEHDYFQKVVSELALYDETRMILDSIFCLSSLILQRTDPSAIEDLSPLKYYEQSINSIRFNLNLPDVDNLEGGTLARCLISTILLCIYELFFVAIDSTYVKGAGSILISILNKKEKSKSLFKNSCFYDTCFWATCVCDLILSLKLGVPSTYSVDNLWSTLDPQYFKEFDDYSPFDDANKVISDPVDSPSSFVISNKKTIWWSHKIVLLYSAINDFANSMDVITLKDYETNKNFYQWAEFSWKLEQFEKNMPLFLKPLIFKPAAKDSTFPMMFFKDSRTAIVTLNLKLAQLGLHRALCSKLKVADLSLVEAEKYKYPPDYTESLAKDVAGIMQTYDSDLRIWPININALRQVSQFISSDSASFGELKQLTTKVIKFCQTRSKIYTLVDT